MPSMFSLLHPRESNSVGQAVNGKWHVLLRVDYFAEAAGWTSNTDYMNKAANSNSSTLIESYVKKVVDGSPTGAEGYDSSGMGHHWSSGALVDYYPRNSVIQAGFNECVSQTHGTWMNWSSAQWPQNTNLFLVFEFNFGYDDGPWQLSNGVNIDDGDYFQIQFRNAQGHYSSGGDSAGANVFDTWGDQDNPYVYQRKLDAHPGWEAGHAYTHPNPIPTWYFAPEVSVIKHDTQGFEKEYLGYEEQTNGLYLKTELFTHDIDNDETQGLDIGLVHDFDGDGAIETEEAILEVKGIIVFYTNIPPSELSIGFNDSDEDVFQLVGQNYGTADVDADGTFLNNEIYNSPWIANQWSDGFYGSYESDNHNINIIEQQVYRLGSSFSASFGETNVLERVVTYGMDQAESGTAPTASGVETITETQGAEAFGTESTDNAYYKCSKTFTITMDEQSLGLDAAELFTIKIGTSFKGGVASGGDNENEWLDWDDHANHGTNMTELYINFDNEFLPSFNILGSTLEIPIPEGFSDIMITRPSDIILHLLVNDLGYDGPISQDDLYDARQEHYDQNYAFTIDADKDGERITTKEFLEDFAASTKLMPKLTNDVLGFNVIRKTYTGVERHTKIPPTDIIRFKFKRTPTENIKTAVNVKYRLDYENNNYLDETGNLDVTSIFPDYDPLYYGVDTNLDDTINHKLTTLDFESKYIRDLSTAQSLQLFLLSWHCNVHLLVNVDLPIKYLNLESGDIIMFEEMVSGVKAYGSDYSNISTINGQTAFPFFLITSINKSLDKISIDAIQLHHNDRIENIAWIGTDVSNPGFEPILPQPDIKSKKPRHIIGDPSNDLSYNNIIDPKRPGYDLSSGSSYNLEDYHEQLSSLSWGEKMTFQVLIAEERKELIDNFGPNIMKIPEQELYLWSEHIIHHTRDHIIEMLAERAKGHSFNDSHKIVMKREAK